MTNGFKFPCETWVAQGTQIAQGFGNFPLGSVTKLKHRFNSYYFKESFFGGRGATWLWKWAKLHVPTPSSCLWLFSKLSSMEIIQVK
jgi:hypothetical protein